MEKIILEIIKIVRENFIIILIFLFLIIDGWIDREK